MILADTFGELGQKNFLLEHWGHPGISLQGCIPSYFNDKNPAKSVRYPCLYLGPERVDQSRRQKLD